VTDHTERPKKTAPSITAMKRTGEKIAVLTAYDCMTAKLVDRGGVDAILVGDSAAMVVLGYKNTLPVTLDAMLVLTAAVARARPRALVIGDLPFMSYQASEADAVRSAGRMVKEGGAEAVKLEGGRNVVRHTRAIIEAGIPVMGHLGLTPQSIHALGGYRVQGRDGASSTRLMEDAAALADAGCFAVVLEAMPPGLGRAITASIPIPTIGIGAGPDCDGQVLVVNDIIGMIDARPAKFVRAYADVSAAVQSAAAAFVSDVKSGDYPSESETY
jgi:3-methyl-2-oxobutanoate hydroxymethyltransferase